MSNTIKKNSPEICRAPTKKRLPCKKHAMKGASFCYIHSLGRIQNVPIWKNATLHFVIGVLLAIAIAIVSYHYTATRGTQNEILKKIDYNTALLDDIWISQNESKLLQKYPSGYVLFGVEPDSINQVRSESRMIPRKGCVLEEYTFKWDRVVISELTDESVTIELPNITFHDIRRTVKTNMLNAGVDKAYRDMILGHRLKGMDTYYLVSTEDSLIAAMDKYTKWLDGQLISDASENVRQNVRHN